MKERRGEAPPSSSFEELPSIPRLGPSVPKQSKVDSSLKGNFSMSSLKSSGRHKNVSGHILKSLFLKLTKFSKEYCQSI